MCLTAKSKIVLDKLWELVPKIQTLGEKGIESCEFFEKMVELLKDKSSGNPIFPFERIFSKIYEMELAEDANGLASEGFFHPLEAFRFLKNTI